MSFVRWTGIFVPIGLICAICFTCFIWICFFSFVQHHLSSYCFLRTFQSFWTIQDSTQDHGKFHAVIISSQLRRDCYHRTVRRRTCPWIKLKLLSNLSCTFRTSWKGFPVTCEKHALKHCRQKDSLYLKQIYLLISNQIKSIHFQLIHQKFNRDLYKFWN